jgi:ketosteroid isomerase-like protein
VDNHQERRLGVLDLDGTGSRAGLGRAPTGAFVHNERGPNVATLASTEWQSEAVGAMRAYAAPIDEQVKVDPSEPAVVASRFLEAFSAADFEHMRALLAEDAVAYVTNAEGGVDKVDGRDAYLGRLEAMDLRSARFSVELTQPPVAVDPDQVLVMVEIHANRSGRSLHNFAAHLLRIADGRITDWRMVDAKPSESDEFWS